MIVVLTWIQDSKAYRADCRDGIWNAPAVISNAGSEVTNSNVAALDIYYKWVLAFEQDNNIWGYVLFMDDTWGGSSNFKYGRSARYRQRLNNHGHRQQQTAG